MEEIRLTRNYLDYSSHDLTTVLASGQQAFFYSVITNQVNTVSILGNNSSRMDALPFMEVLRISTDSNVDLEALRIDGNKVEIANSGSSTIQVEIGTTASSLTFYLLAGKKAEFIFNGSSWLHDQENVITMTDAALTLDDMTGPTHVIMPSSGITANRTVTLPTLADNQNFKVRFDNLNTTYALYIDGEGAETIESFAIINLSSEWCILEGQASEWKRVAFDPDRPFYHYQDQKATSNDGGSSVATTWTKRTCDDEVINTIIGASESSSVHTLPPGIYDCHIKSPYYRVGDARIRLRNTSDGTDEFYSNNDYGNSTNGNVMALVDDRLTITASKNFEIQYYVATAVATNGLGIQSGSGIIEIYTGIKFTKIL